MTTPGPGTQGGGASCFARMRNLTSEVLPCPPLEWLYFHHYAIVLALGVFNRTGKI